jgi:tetratricopeptide (TPR) repeat protein
MQMTQVSGGWDTGEKDGDAAAMRFQKGLPWSLSGDTLRQSRRFQKALEARPRDARWLEGLAAAVDRPGFLFARPQPCRTGRCHGPALPDAWFLGGLSLYWRGNYTGAADCLGHAVALLQDHTETGSFLGTAVI